MQRAAPLREFNPGALPVTRQKSGMPYDVRTEERHAEQKTIPTHDDDDDDANALSGLHAGLCWYKIRNFENPLHFSGACEPMSIPV